VDWLKILDHLGKLAAAYFLALPVGWERERVGRSAGLRTFPLVAIASCGYVLLAENVISGSPEARARIIEGLITGMGFIGGGAILKQTTSDGAPTKVSGTATAASLWNTGAIGAAAGHGSYEIAVVLSIVNLVTLHLLAALKREPEEGRE
jgi:putative Mg2+ transporter-C (MgtC) family protein